MGKTQGLRGNLSELSLAWIKQEYGELLMDGESVITGFELVRDCVIFTNKRIINIDHCGLTRSKMRVTSVYLGQIIGVALETAGAMGDHEIRICYIRSINRRMTSGVKTAELRYEFPKRADCKPLYKWLQKVALENYETINH